MKNFDVLKLAKGDILVIKSEAQLSIPAQNEIKAQIKEIFPNNKVIVLDRGLSLQVVAPPCGG